MAAEREMDSPSRIRVLPPELADQIAAGEVIERPASVVKELVENALDAGARRIDIEVEAGGKGLIRVVDDGCGMSEEEARLSLVRHATSKLRTAEELAHLATMGFRGEALPSIAAVSRLMLTTRARGAVAAWRISMAAGREGEAGPAGAPEGTCVEVRDLLHNQPARLKFLKAEHAEAAHIHDLVERLALAWPEVHVRLRQGARLTLDLPPCTEGERARAILGHALYLATGEEGGVRVRALLGAPSASQASSRGMFLYVDRRYIRDRGLGHALAMGYGELVERGRYPSALLHLELPPGEVDVNVHPQKTEVRFRRPQEVYAAVRHVVRAGLAGTPWLGGVARPPAARIYAMPPQSEADRASVREAVREGAYLASTPHVLPSTEAAAEGPSFVGQLAGTYLLFESAGELLVLDQHAAHERVTFERLRRNHAERAQAPARLLFPVVVSASVAELSATVEHAETLAALGFEIEPFGADAVAVKALPQPLADADPEALARQVLGQLVEHGDAPIAGDLADRVLATMACHGSRRAGDRMGEPEARALLLAVATTEHGDHCPHGRPALVRIPIGELARRFGR
jgi:DNA mismatch repair protein MutL